jgi:Tol biopolymer transport system component
VRYPSLARNAACLAFESRRETQDIMQLSLDRFVSSFLDAEPLIVSNVLDCEPAWSPDRAEIAFISTRSGHRELWLCDSAGSHPRQLTAIAGAYVAKPIWSPDGGRLAFMAAADDISVHVIDAIGGTPQRITKAGHNALPCSWSRDGGWIYYASDVSGGWQIWRVDPDGGDSRQVTTEGGIAAAESPDGRSLYLVRPDQNGIWRRSIDGGNLDCKVPRFPASQFQSWEVGVDGIFFASPTDSKTTILLYDPRSDVSREIAEIPSYPTPRFSVSPDSRSLLFVRSDQLDIDLQLLVYLPED